MYNWRVGFEIWTLSIFLNCFIVIADLVFVIKYEKTLREV